MCNVSSGGSEVAPVFKKNDRKDATDKLATRMADRLAERGKTVDPELLAQALKSHDQEALRSAMGASGGQVVVTSGDPSQALAKFAELHEKGLISDERYNSIRERFGSGDTSLGLGDAQPRSGDTSLGLGDARPSSGDTPF